MERYSMLYKEHYIQNDIYGTWNAIYGIVIYGKLYTERYIGNVENGMLYKEHYIRNVICRTLYTERYIRNLIY